MTSGSPLVDTNSETLVDPWWTPGWTAQNFAYQLAPVGPWSNISPGTPPLSYATATGLYFDLDGNPLGGYLTFMPSDDCTFTTDIGGSPVTWDIPRRLSGTNTFYADAGVYGFAWAMNQEATGAIYIEGGLFAVTLATTDQTGLATVCGQTLTYHVIEHMEHGYEYDIIVPTADDSSPIQLSSLIVAGSKRKYKFDPAYPLGNQNFQLRDPNPPVVTDPLGNTWEYDAENNVLRPLLQDQDNALITDQLGTDLQ